MIDEIIEGDALVELGKLEADSIDLLCTDPPYGISFMGKSWDKALPDINIWRECLRVLKPGAFAFVMSIPRADCLSRMIISLEDAGFNVGFSPIYWAYASGFPKAQNIGKTVDKKLGTYKEGEVLPSSRVVVNENNFTTFSRKTAPNPQSPQAKALDGSYAGAQMKPAVEVIIVAMKPLSEKTYVDQALKNGKGITWLDDCRVPTQPRTTHKGRNLTGNSSRDAIFSMPNIETTMPNSRFPANLLVSDDVLDDGNHRSSGVFDKGGTNNWTGGQSSRAMYNDSGSFSRYYDLDKWWEERIKQLPASVQKTFPFLIVPKASKSEKNKGLEGMEAMQTNDGRNKLPDNAFQRGKTYRYNHHPTCKPLKLMSYLITLGSRPGDVVLDPFVGSGTTALAAGMIGRKCIGIEISAEYAEIARKRLSQSVMKLEELI